MKEKSKKCLPPKGCLLRRKIGTILNKNLISTGQFLKNWTIQALESRNMGIRKLKGRKTREEKEVHHLWTSKLRAAQWEAECVPKSSTKNMQQKPKTGVWEQNGNECPAFDNFYGTQNNSLIPFNIFSKSIYFKL